MKMDNLEKIMEDSFVDMNDQIQVMSDRFEKLDAELKEHGKNQTEQLKAHFDERIKASLLDPHSNLKRNLTLGLSNIDFAST